MLSAADVRLNETTQRVHSHPPTPPETLSGFQRSFVDPTQITIFNSETLRENWSKTNRLTAQQLVLAFSQVLVSYNDIYRTPSLSHNAVKSEDTTCDLHIPGYHYHP